MQIQRTQSRLARLVKQQLCAGRFDSATGAIERMRASLDRLDHQTVSAITRSGDQHTRGDLVEWRAVQDDMPRKHVGK